MGTLPVSETPDTAERPFLGPIQAFRGIAIAWIVAFHCLFALDWSGRPDLHRELAIVLHNGSALFVFIAGYLFQHVAGGAGGFRYGDYLSRKARFIVLPYVICSIPAIAHDLVRHPPESAGAAIADVAMALLTGDHLTPLWFIPMICLYYLAAPPLLALDRRGWILALVPPLLAIALIVPRDIDNVPQTALHFLPVYMLGMACSRWRGRVEPLLRRGTVPLLLAAAAAAVGEAARPAWGEPLNLLQKLAVCGLLVGWLERWATRPPRLLAYLATISFGLYFTHFYAVKALDLGAERALGAAIPGNLATLAGAFVLVTASCAGGLALARRALGPSSRFVVGC